VHPSRTVIRRPAALLALALAGTLTLAACGGAAATPAPATPAPATATPAPTATATPTPAPTPSPTLAPTPTPAPTEAPSEGAATANPAALGGFAFKPGDVLDYYISAGFTCEDPEPSDVAAGYTNVRCLKTDEAGTTALVALAVDDAGVTGDGFAGYITPAGSAGPDRKAAAEHLGGFAAAMLGTDLGEEAAIWAAQNLDAVDLQASFGGIAAIVYQENDEGGVGPYVEFASPAYLNAPAP
jgi:hypothetical protein